MSRLFSLLLVTGLSLVGGSAAVVLGLHWLARWQARQPPDPIDDLIVPPIERFARLTSAEYDALRRDAATRRTRVEAEQRAANKLSSGEPLHERPRLITRAR